MIKLYAEELLMNNKELHDKVHAAMYRLIKDKGVA